MCSVGIKALLPWSCSVCLLSPKLGMQWVCVEIKCSCFSGIKAILPISCSVRLLPWKLGVCFFLCQIPLLCVFPIKWTYHSGMYSVESKLLWPEVAVSAHYHENWECFCLWQMATLMLCVYGLGCVLLSYVAVYSWLPHLVFPRPSSQCSCCGLTWSPTAYPPLLLVSTHRRRISWSSRRETHVFPWSVAGYSLDTWPLVVSLGSWCS